jgi:hypothetical protein
MYIDVTLVQFPYESYEPITLQAGPRVKDRYTFIVPKRFLHELPYDGIQSYQVKLHQCKAMDAP